MELQQQRNDASAIDARNYSLGQQRRYSIGDLAREFGISLRTLRFYENRGLLQPRRDGSSRIYSPSDKVRLQLILKGKQLGFTLSEVREMINAQGQDKTSSLEQTLKPEQIRVQIEHLERQRAEIDRALEELRGVSEKLQASDMAQAV
jgi:DNA-binding transcriptional MerR regulator